MRALIVIGCLLALAGCGDKESTVFYEARSDVLPMDILLTDRDGFRTETTHESPWRKMVVLAAGEEIRFTVSTSGSGTIEMLVLFEDNTKVTNYVTGSGYAVINTWAP